MLITEQNMHFKESIDEKQAMYPKSKQAIVQNLLFGISLSFV